MPHLYTRTGDSGYTFCATLGTRIPKSHILMEFVGTLDEANSFIGFARSFLPTYLKELDDELKNMQRLLFRVGFSFSKRELQVTEEDVRWLENLADKYYGEESLRYFILPSGPTAASALHVARSVVRRAERLLVKIYLEKVIDVDEVILKTLNRMSDTLFAMALWLVKKLGTLPEPLEEHDEI